MIRWSGGSSALLALSLLLGCYPWVGPLRLTIETNGEPYDDVVVYSSLALAGIHETDLVRHEPRVVSSEQEIRLGPWFRSPRFDGIRLQIYHPRFRHVWYAQSHLHGGPLELRFEMESLPRLFEQQPAPGLEIAGHHLGLLKSSYLPALDEQGRREFRCYLPELRRFVEDSRYVSEHWDPLTKQELRSGLEEALAELVRATE